MTIFSRLPQFFRHLATPLIESSEPTYASVDDIEGQTQILVTLATGDHPASMANIYFLATEWILFGCLHFAFANATAKELPKFLSNLGINLEIVIYTGFLEVAIGFALLFAETRRFAAALSMLVVVLYVPAVYTVIENYNTLPVPPNVLPDPTLAETLFVMAMTPNNIVIFICSLMVLQASRLAPFRFGGFRMPSVDWAGARGQGTALIALLFLLSNIAGFAVILANRPSVEGGASSFWALMCLAAGNLVGFLFGVPKTSLDSDSLRKARFLPNTNIEAISDWLTKILVGVGLVNIKQIVTEFHRVAALLGKAIWSNEMYAAGLIGYFSVLGVIEGYILTRIYLSDRLEEHDPRAAALAALDNPAPAVPPPPAAASPSRPAEPRAPERSSRTDAPKPQRP